MIFCVDHYQGNRDSSIAFACGNALEEFFANITCWRGCIMYIESVHCREEGCIGKYTPRGPRDFPRAGILHPRPERAISRAEYESGRIWKCKSKETKRKTVGLWTVKPFLIELSFSSVFCWLKQWIQQPQWSEEDFCWCWVGCPAWIWCHEHVEQASQRQSGGKVTKLHKPHPCQHH